MTVEVAIVSVMAKSEPATMSLMFNFMIRCQRKLILFYLISFSV